MQAVKVVFAFAVAFIGWQSSSSLAEQQRVPMNPEFLEGPDSYYATEFKCPRLSPGVLEFSMRTPAGALSRVWVDYSADRPVKVKMLVTPAGRPTETAVGQNGRGHG